MREVMVQRKREEMDRAREDRARREAYAAELDRKIFEEELRSSASREGGANPVKLQVDLQVQPGGSSAAEQRGSQQPGGEELSEELSEELPPYESCYEFRFTNNSAPLRTVVVGKGSAFKPVLEESLKRRALQSKLCCQGGHVLRDMGYRDSWRKCRICKRSGVMFHCPNWYDYSLYGTPCYEYTVCERCHKNDREDKLRAASDPKKHETFMVAEPGSFLSLMLPTDTVPETGAFRGDPAAAASYRELCASQAVAGVTLGLDFTVTLELMLPALPPKGQRLALLRFECSPPHSPPATTTTRTKNAHTHPFFSSSSIPLLFFFGGWGCIYFISCPLCLKGLRRRLPRSAARPRRSRPRSTPLTRARLAAPTWPPRRSGSR